MGIQLIDILEKLHMKGYVHCDIKPDNIMIGDYTRDTELKRKIYIIDLGISHRYFDENGEHIPF